MRYTHCHTKCVGRRRQLRLYASSLAYQRDQLVPGGITMMVAPGIPARVAARLAATSAGMPVDEIAIGTADGNAAWGATGVAGGGAAAAGAGRPACSPPLWSPGAVCSPRESSPFRSLRERPGKQDPPWSSRPNSPTPCRCRGCLGWFGCFARPSGRRCLATPRRLGGLPAGSPRTAAPRAHRSS